MFPFGVEMPDIDMAIQAAHICFAGYKTQVCIFSLYGERFGK
jgi:hypothetical protein